MRVTTFDGAGKVIAEVDLPDEPAMPLDRDAQLAALLAAKGVITAKEAADLTGHSEEKLTAEVEAWAVAEVVTKR